MGATSALEGSSRLCNIAAVNELVMIVNLFYLGEETLTSYHTSCTSFISLYSALFSILYTAILALLNEGNHYRICGLFVVVNVSNHSLLQSPKRQVLL